MDEVLSVRGYWICSGYHQWRIENRSQTIFSIYDLNNLSKMSFSLNLQKISLKLFLYWNWQEQILFIEGNSMSSVRKIWHDRLRSLKFIAYQKSNSWLHQIWKRNLSGPSMVLGGGGLKIGTFRKHMFIKFLISQPFIAQFWWARYQNLTKSQLYIMQIKGEQLLKITFPS